MYSRKFAFRFVTTAFFVFLLLFTYNCHEFKFKKVFPLSIFFLLVTQNIISNTRNFVTNFKQKFYSNFFIILDFQLLSLSFYIFFNFLCGIIFLHSYIEFFHVNINIFTITKYSVIIKLFPKYLVQVIFSASEIHYILHNTIHFSYQN